MAKKSLDTMGVEWWLNNRRRYKEAGGYKRFVELVELDWPDADIAKEFGVEAYQTIADWRKRAGLTKGKA